METEAKVALVVNLTRVSLIVSQAVTKLFDFEAILTRAWDFFLGKPRASSIEIECSSLMYVLLQFSHPENKKKLFWLRILCRSVQVKIPT